jgi:hypothetical protein
MFLKSIKFLTIHSDFSDMIQNFILNENNSFPVSLKALYMSCIHKDIIIFAIIQRNE